MAWVSKYLSKTKTNKCLLICLLMICRNLDLPNRYAMSTFNEYFNVMNYITDFDMKMIRYINIYANITTIGLFWIIHMKVDWNWSQRLFLLNFKENFKSLFTLFTFIFAYQALISCYILNFFSCTKQGVYFIIAIWADLLNWI